MTKQVLDLIQGIKMINEVGIVLKSWTKEMMIDEIILTMGYINSLTMSKMERAYTVNNIMPHKPWNKHEATQRVARILDAK